MFYLLNINQPAKQMLVGDGKIAAWFHFIKTIQTALELPKASLKVNN